MTASAHLLEGDTSADVSPFGDEPAARRGKSRHPGVLRKALGWVVLVALVAALWPATWGGLIGITVVNGRSMEPSFETNDLVLTLRHRSYDVGDVISYKVPEGQDGAGGRVIHRIIALDDSGATPIFTTQGDNNSSVDPWTFTTSDVLGEATLHLPRVGAAFNGSSGLLAGAAAGLLVLVLLWPSTPKRRTGEKDEQPPEATG